MTLSQNKESWDTTDQSEKGRHSTTYTDNASEQTYEPEKS